MHVTDQQRLALESLFQTIAPSKSERWCYLLERPPSRWEKISPIDVWPLPSSFDSYPNEPIAQLLTMPPLSRHLQANVLVLRCGHSSNPGLLEMPLKDVFPDGDWDYKILFEGFVSIVPGKVAIAANHEGGIYVYGA